MENGMDTDCLSEAEKGVLLSLARQALEYAVHGQKLPPLDLKELSPRLKVEGASFVTLTKSGELRGCIGALEPYQPLAQDVREHAIAAALEDYRFPPVQPAELPDITIEVSRLTQPQPLDYASPEDLLAKLRPGMDGVVLRDGRHRATFLPQVWEKVPDPSEFLDHLCYKMGEQPDVWRKRSLEVLIYQVEEFHE
jgi:AmmeMemoRadiSam system protein A